MSRRMMTARRSLRWLAIPAALVLFLAGTAPAAERVLLDRVRIVVDDLVLTDREVNSLLQLRSRDLRQQYEGEELEQRLAALEQNLIDRAVEDLLLQSRASRLGIQIDEETIEQRLDSIVAREPNVLDIYGEEEIKDFIVKDLLKQRVLQQEVNAFIHVSEQEIREECQRSQQDARKVRVGHILVRGEDEDALERIMKIRSRVTDGEDFLEVAAEVSQDPSARQNRGDLGFISRGQFVKEFEEAAFNLDVGEISNPVRTQFGYHLIKVFEERTESNVDCGNMDTATRDRIHDRLYDQRREARLEEYFARLREQAQIRIVEAS